MVTEKFYILIRVVFTLVYTIVKTHQIVHLRSVQFIDCELYLEKYIYMPESWEELPSKIIDSATLQEKAKKEKGAVMTSVAYIVLLNHKPRKERSSMASRQYSC